MLLILRSHVFPQINIPGRGYRGQRGGEGRGAEGGGRDTTEEERATQLLIVSYSQKALQAAMESHVNISTT